MCGAARTLLWLVSLRSATAGACSKIMFLVEALLSPSLLRLTPDGADLIVAAAKARLKSPPGCCVAPLCPSRHPPQSVSACLSIVAGRILSTWAPNHARPFTAHRFGRRRSGRRKDARKPTGSPSRRGTSACSVFRVRRSQSPALGDAINAGYRYLEVKCLGYIEANRSFAKRGPRH